MRELCCENCAHVLWHERNPDELCGDDCNFEPTPIEPLTHREATEAVAFARLETIPTRRLYATLTRYAALLKKEEG